MPAHKKTSSPKTASHPQPRGRFVMSPQEQTAYMVEHYDYLAKHPDLAVEALQRAGILDKNGKLSKRYRADVAA